MPESANMASVMTFITYLAVAASLSSLFFTPAAAKSCFHSGGMLLISKPLSVERSIFALYVVLDGANITANVVTHRDPNQCAIDGGNSSGRSS